jgi:hypothetical protein
MRSTLNRKFDPTEVDMRLGDLLIEAKLAESDVQESQKAVFHAFRDFRELFVHDGLSQTAHGYRGSCRC